jgi:hypothetical protein
MTRRVCAASHPALCSGFSSSWDSATDAGIVAQQTEKTPLVLVQHPSVPTRLERARERCRWKRAAHFSHRRRVLSRPDVCRRQASRTRYFTATCCVCTWNVSLSRRVLTGICSPPRDEERAAMLARAPRAVVPAAARPSVLRPARTTTCSQPMEQRRPCGANSS